MAKSLYKENKKSILFGVLSCCIALAIGVIIGYFSKPDGIKSRYSEDSFKSDSKIIKKAIEEVDGQSVRDYLQVLSSEPHLAGLYRDEELVQWIQDEWTKAGLDRVELATYDFYLSFPNQTNPNTIKLLDSAGQVVHTSKHQEDEVRPGDAHEEFVHSYSAYAPPGEVTEALVYVNYADVADLEYLESINVNLTGKIAIARYGKVFRGNKLDNCWRKGAIGMIIFSDPADVAPFGVEPDDVYPKSIYLPPTGMQRGTVFVDNGDPLSPFWPSVPNAYRIPREENELMPLIPCQPIGYEDAKVLLQQMGGPASPADWRGGIEGVDYNIGGEMIDGHTVQLSVHNYEQDVKSSNVIGYIEGGIEPDRYVYLSNHRDAWGYGAMDPSSGTANLMEIARVLGKLRKTGWKPRRTIVFCSWAAEELGLMGSEEWVQDKIDKIMARSVGLLNTDICVRGPIPEVSASPSLRDVVIDSLKYVQDWDGRGSLYDVWYQWYNQERKASRAVDPEIFMLDSGSDQANFIFYAGVPSIDLTFNVDHKTAGVSGYPSYHTGYETFYLMDTLVDPNFKIHRACTQVSLHILFQLADSLIIPYNFRLLAEDIKKAINILNTEVSDILALHNVTLEHVTDAVNVFSDATEDYIRYMDGLNAKSDPVELKMVNDQIMALERVFLLPQGLPLGRVKNRHAIFSPALFNQYGGAAFPGITDLLEGIDSLPDDELEARKKELQRHVSDLMIIIRNAASFLKPFGQI